MGHSLTQVILPAFQLFLQPHRQTESVGRYSHPGLPCYSPPLSARYGPDLLGVYCHSSHIGRQTGENPCGIHLALPPTDRSGSDACFGGGLPVLLAGDLNAKHVDCNSRLNTRLGKLLHDYADENSCLIFGPNAPTTNPYRSNATPDVLEIAMV